MSYQKALSLAEADALARDGIAVRELAFLREEGVLLNSHPFKAQLPIVVYRRLAELRERMEAAEVRPEEEA